MSEETKNITEKSLEASTISAFFKMIYLMVKETNLTIIIYTLILLINLGQSIYFKFHDIVLSIWKDSQADTIAKIFGYFNFTHYLIGQDFNIYQIIYYLAIGLVGLQIMTVLITMIFIVNLREPAQFMILVVRLLTLSMITILFTPILFLFTFPLNCKSDGTMLYFANKVCWSGLLVIDQIIAIIAIIFFISIQSIMSLLYFEGTYDQNRVLSKRNGRCAALSCIHQSIVILLTLLPKGSNSQVLFEVYGLIGSFCCFMYAKRNDAYNNRIAQKFILTYYTVDLWTSLMLCVAHLVEGRIMVGSIYTWMFCLPLVFIIQIIQQQPREQCLMIYVNKFDSAIQLVNHALEVLQLVEYDKRRLPQGQLLNGYIEFHNQTCPNPLCPLKKVKFSLNMFKAKNEILSKTDKRHQLIYDTMGRLYMLGMGKFTTDVFIRIEYALFTLRILKSKPQALEELNNVEKMKCPLDLKYSVFYIKSVIEAEIQELSGDGQDFTEQRDFEEKFNSFKNAMERSVALLMEFWSQFADEKPDLMKLYEIGSKLFPIRMYVDTTWKRLQRVQNQQLPQALRLYSKYLIEIFNDRLSGFDLLEQARKIETQFAQRKAFKLGLSSNLNIDGQEDGCVFISLEEDRFGQIYALNMAAASLIGYDKNEIMNKKVNNIMPLLYARYHDDFLKRFLDTNEATLLNKERQLLGKNKNLYLQPINVLLRPVYHVLKEGVEFVATFKRDKKIKDVAYLVCNKDYLVEDITSTCITLLGIDLKSLQIQEIHLTDLLPDLSDNFVDYKLKSGKNIDFVQPKILDDHIAYQASEIVIKLNVTIIEINFLIMKSSENENGLAGYQVKFERIVDLNSSNNKFGQKILKQNNFQFRPLFQQMGMGFFGEFTDATYSEMMTHLQENSLMVSNQDYENNMISKQGESRQSSRHEKLLDEVVDYAVGIRTMRLFEGQVYDIEKFQSDQDMESYEEVQIKKEEQQNQDEEHEGEVGYFRSSKELQETLNQQSESRTIKWLYYMSTILMTILISLAILNNVFERSEISNQDKNWNLILRQSEIIMSINQIVSISRELMLLNFGFTHYNYTDLISHLDLHIQEFDQLSKDIYKSIDYQNSVKMFQNMNDYESSILEQASQQLVSKALNVLKLKQSEITADQIDYFYVNFNVLNDYMRSLLSSYMTIVEKAKSQTTSLKGDTLVILVISACLTLIASLFLASILTSTLDKRQEILSIFLDIPEKTAKLFYSKCENFLQQISSNEDDEVMSEMDIQEEKSVEENVSLLGRKKKRFKNNESKHLGFFIKMLIIAAIIESYYILIYFLNANNIDKKEHILDEFNQTAISSSYYGFTMNSVKQFIFNKSIPILNSESNITVAELIENTYQIDTTYQRLHAVNVDFNSLNFVDYYNSIMFDDLCLIVVNPNCKTFASGILAHGLMTAVSRHFQNIRKLYTSYQAIYGNSSMDFPWSNYTLINLSSDREQNMLYNILNVPESYEINEMQFEYVKQAFSILKNNYLVMVNQDQETFIVQQLIIMIFFLITMVISLLFCWNPFLSRLNREIWSTKCLLTFIPIDEIAKIRTINNYIRTVILEQNI